MMEKDEKETILWKCIEERIGEERIGEERTKNVEFDANVFDGIMDAMEQYAKLKVS